MLWELIATIFAGMGGAGIALFFRKISKQKAPKWLVPVFAGIAMLGFQIQGEYDWFDHQTSLLPDGVVVVKTIQEEAPWRPWSYIYPQTLRFMAADVANAAKNEVDPNLVLVDLYFFERRQTAKRVPQIVDCLQGARTDFTKSFSTDVKTNNSQWRQLDANDPLLNAVCAG
ncbi:hypothetical protein [Marinomonas transparens]|uniref:Uncharacterized protein n=1 Tax=Marinomonas transparens TaxID=2795388 RepID=A0A934JRD6_9GAMM|nr:hypothetical protein [Marinomonas transparens]MBJ7539293.1 hypothetical protein [Marinomonas transparens]